MFKEAQQMALEALKGRLGLSEGRIQDFAKSNKAIDEESLVRNQDIKNAIHTLENHSPLDPLKEALHEDEDIMNRPTCGPAGDLGELHIVKGERNRLGSCNFCSGGSYKYVHELSGQNLKVRLCGKCLDKIKKYRED